MDMDDNEETSIKPNAKEEEEAKSAANSVQSDVVVLDNSSLVEPESTIVARKDDIVVTELAAVKAEKVGSCGVGYEGVLDGGAQGSIESVEVEDLELAGEEVREEGNEVRVNGEEVAKEAEVEREVEVTMIGVAGFGNELELKVEGGEAGFGSEVGMKQENEKEVVGEGLIVEAKMESEIVDRRELCVDSMAELVGDFMSIDAANGETEAMEEELGEVKAIKEDREDGIKAMEGVGKAETEAIDEVEKDECEAVLKVEKDETEAMEEVEEDERRPMEKVRKDDGERESTGGEDGLEIVGIGKDGNGNLVAAEDDDQATATGEDAQEVEGETPESVKSAGGKRKRGKNLKVSTRPLATRKAIVEEDVCFICFDGGDLVLCDRRGCTKAYHPSCVNRDEAFFQAKGHWHCGWHLCSMCEKDAYVMCYTCTFSSCKSCLKDAGMLCVKKTRGFCGTCMKTVLLIENIEKGNQEEPVDFDDKSSWEYLFKDYWIDVKARLSLSLKDLLQDKNARKGSDLADKQESRSEQFDDKDHVDSGSDNSAENLEASKKKRRKAKKRGKSITKEADTSTAAVIAGAGENSKSENTEWATKELLEFTMHMRNGDRSVASQYDVQGLLLEYIRINDLRDPKRKSQIICDSRLENLFGKPRVGHFEMLKLIESHFLIKEESQTDDVQGSVVNTDAVQMDGGETPEAQTKSSKSRKRKARRKGDGRGSQFNRGEYAAIDTHNIGLIYLRRKLVEDLLEDTENFQDRVVGTFVRIRILGTNQKQDMYRLVQVVGTSKAAEPYKIDKRTAGIMLDIVNLNKTEVISIDVISNQEFTEDECKRLRQSIKCGLIKRLTVGDILDKAMEVQAARVNDWLETEKLRLSHLCDRASDMGHRKELRESVEKLKILNTPEERLRRIEEVPVINVDPNMDPSYVSEDDSDMEEKKQEMYMRPRGGSSFNRRGSDPVSPGSSKDSWSGTVKNVGENFDTSRNLSNIGFSTKAEDAAPSSEMRNENSCNQGCGKIKQQANNIEKPSPATNSEAPPSNITTETDVSISEVAKMWHYKDPAGKNQGPFSLVQLRKWSNSKYFPVDLRIWRVTEKEDDNILLTDALAGKFASLKRTGQDTPSGVYLANPTPGQQLSRGLTTPLVELPNPSIDGRNESRGENAPYRSANSLPSGDGPTPDSTPQTCSSTPSSVNPSGSTVPNASGALGTSIDSSNSNSAFGATLNSNQGVPLGSANLLQTSQSGHLVPAPDNNHMAGHVVQSIPGQNSIVSHGWGGAPTQNLQPNSSMNAAGQVVAHNQWTGVPSMVQSPAGTVPQPDHWGQAPVPSNQPNMQQPQPFPIPNVAWGAMQGNPNMGWVGDASGNPSMNWGAMIQGPVAPGNVNPSWVMPTGGNFQGPMPGNMNVGWVAPSNQGWVPPYNQGWVAAPTQGPVVPMNGNPGWSMLDGNQGGIAQGPIPGNAFQSWGPPTGNQGAPAQGPTTGNVNQDGFSGQKVSRGSQGGNRGRPWNRNNRGRDRDGDRHSSFGRGRPRSDSISTEPIVCPFYPNRPCNLGSNCKFLHT